jgi:hypothetical protein
VDGDAAPAREAQAAGVAVEPVLQHRDQTGAQPANGPLVGRHPDALAPRAPTHLVGRRATAHGAAPGVLSGPIADLLDRHFGWLSVTRVKPGSPARSFDCIRLVIVDKAGKTYGCVSNTLLRSLATICYVFGTPPWATPIKLTVRTKRNGEKAIYWFEAK